MTLEPFSKMVRWPKPGGVREHGERFWCDKHMVWEEHSTAKDPLLQTPPLFILFHSASPSKPSSMPSPKSPGDSSHFHNLSALSLQLASK